MTDPTPAERIAEVRELLTRIQAAQRLPWRSDADLEELQLMYAVERLVARVPLLLAELESITKKHDDLWNEDRSDVPCTYCSEGGVHDEDYCRAALKDHLKVAFDTLRSAVGAGARDPEKKPVAHSDLTMLYFANLIGPLREVAYNHGYALTVHGSLVRDIDLVAIPWTSSAVRPRVLADAIQAKAATICKRAGNDDAVGAANPDFFFNGCPGGKRHGRLVWTFHLGGGPYLDFSVMPCDDEDLRTQLVVANANEQFTREEMATLRSKVIDECAAVCAKFSSEKLGRREYWPDATTEEWTSATAADKIKDRILALKEETPK